MKISIWDKIDTLWQAEKSIHKYPQSKIKWITYINPIDSTRYHEFSYLLKYIKQNKLNPQTILDVSSPSIMAYMLSARGKVIKTDIDGAERATIRETSNLHFMEENATKLSFPDNSFDLVCSISVIEHIYDEYQKALKEMVRVLKPGGYLYLTFPVSCEYQEEWLDAPIYAKQYKRGSEYFFQYRFNKAYVDEMFNELTNVTVISKDIYWERYTGDYDRFIKALRDLPQIYIVTPFLVSIMNLFAGIFLLDSCAKDFYNARSFGNISIIIKKTV